MYKNNSVVVCGNKVFIVTIPYMMVVIERTRDGRTLKRVYHDPANLSDADKRDFLFARVVKNINEKYR